MQRLHFAEVLLPEGWARDVEIAIADGRITAVAAGVPRASEGEGHAIGLPGVPNLHCHAFQRAMAGRAEVRGPTHDTFWTWRDAMYRVALGVGPEDIEAIAAQLYVEMLEAGFTHVGEFHYLHHDRDGTPYADAAETATRIAAAAAATGIGLTLLPTFYAHSGFGGAPPVPGQRRFVSTLEGFARIMEGSRRAITGLPGAGLGVAPHSLRAVTPSELAAVVPMAGGGPVHLHIAEQVKEVEDCRAALGARPVEWLLASAAVDARWCLVHATHMTEAETLALAASGAVAGPCPVTEANLGDGVFNGPQFLAAGGRFGVGSDSNVLIGAAAELRQLEYAQRLRDRARNVLAGEEEGRSTGRRLFAAAVKGGAQALRLDHAGIAVGASADLVSLDPSHPQLIGASGDAILDGFIFAAPAGTIDCVWRHGEKLVAGGRHRRREECRAAFAKAIRQLS